MKAKTLFLIGLCLLLNNNLRAQIPNPSFENWINIGGWFDNPVDWNTNNSQIIVSTVTPDSDAYGGFLAMRLQNSTIIRPVAYTQFANALNILSLTAYVKLKLIINDTVCMQVFEFYNGNVVDSGVWLGLTDILNYTPITIPVSQNSLLIDSVVIKITGGNQTNLIFEGTKFLVDYLQLTTVSGVPELQNQMVSLAPNPVNSKLLIKANVAFYKIEIYNSLGMQLRSYPANDFQKQSSTGLINYELPVNDLKVGMYFIKLYGKQSTSASFVKTD